MSSKKCNFAISNFKQFFTMIQRIQTIFLLVAFIATIVLMFVPFGTFVGCFADNLDGMCVYNAFTVRLDLPAPENSVIARTTYIALSLIVSAILSLVSIFMYKNRKAQAKVVSFSMFALLIALAFTYYIYPDVVFTKANIIYLDTECTFTYWVLVLYLLPAVMMVLARRFIYRDEAMVRAADRLR